MTESPNDLAGTVALVTGASAGIGLATARALAARGAGLVLVGRTAERLEAAAEPLRAGGREVLVLALDIADFAAVDRGIAGATRQLGRIDHLINNAGTIEPIAPIHLADPAAWTASIAANLFGVFHLCRAVLPQMLTAGRGTIVNISSGAALRPLDGWSAYCTGKAAAAMFTRSLVDDYAAAGLRIYDFTPGMVATDMQLRIRQSGINEVSRLPPERLLPPADPAAVIAYLCAAASADLPSGPLSIRDAALRARVGLREREAW